MTVDAQLSGGIVRPVTEVTSWLGGAPLGVVPISQGSVSEYASGGQLGALRIVVPATPELVPFHPRHPLAAFGQELIVRRGFLTSDGEPVDWENLGTFRISETPTASDGWLEVDAVSVDSRLASAAWTVATTTSGSRHTQIRQICSGVVPVTLAVGDASATSRRWEQQSSRWDALLEVCDAWGYVPRMVDGRLTIVPEPTGTTPELTVRSGLGGSLVRVDPVTGGGLVPNAVVASSAPEDESAPISVMVPLYTGPRRWGGPYGQIPAFFGSPLLTTWAGCKSAAATRLARYQAAAPEVRVQAITDPRLRLGTVVRVLQEEKGTDLIVRATEVTHALTADREPGDFAGVVLSGVMEGASWL